MIAQAGFLSHHVQKLKIAIADREWARHENFENIIPMTMAVPMQVWPGGLSNSRPHQGQHHAVWHGGAHTDLF